MLTLLPTPMGNLDDITLRSLRALEQADVLLCEDVRVSKKLLALLAKNPMIHQHFPKISQTKEMVSFHSHNQAKYISNLSAELFERNVVYMSDAGMPCVSDPGAALVAYAIQNNIAYDILPGGSACVGAYCASGFESDGFLFAGFLPHKQKEKITRLSNLLTSAAFLDQKIPIIVYESPHRIIDTLENIAKLAGDMQIFAIKEMTKMHQKYFIGSAKEVYTQIQSSNTNGEWVLVLLGTQKPERTLSATQITQMDLPPKIKAKLLSKLQDIPTKNLYEQISKKELL
ncbi:16S rRNA (cytidine(1402)-2'-O)-methyltransferase [Helicobacter sp. 12S02634-8]|uniref:16S rRNA (cytidine(1402)-2'-O)-methyltransferase n=1 Tax=Helicobacter sp. 12S02634-8 TaxID=1476199 RepID=UPI000BA6C060|nr:16S rRNA (cytidine(1402)-2'-O)-methyltransferase [Helicobacter sp. 12S02634-8]PAF48051.1 16S rRNA (cytidine(1402)-2'-O)-methyltransferase [Helicobacter sp. 12S02634-8]